MFGKFRLRTVAAFTVFSVAAQPVSPAMRGVPGDWRVVLEQRRSLARLLFPMRAFLTGLRAQGAHASKLRAQSAARLRGFGTASVPEGRQLTAYLRWFRTMRSPASRTNRPTRDGAYPISGTFSRPCAVMSYRTQDRWICGGTEKQVVKVVLGEVLIGRFRDEDVREGDNFKTLGRFEFYGEGLED